MTEKDGDIGDSGLGLIQSHTVNDEGVGWSSPWCKCLFSP